MINSDMQRHIAKQACLFTFGPKSWDNIVIGFIEKLNLPDGFGKYGCWFGWSLPFPVGFFLASSSDKI